MPVAQQRLIFRGAVLQDVAASGEANTLRAVGVLEDGDTLHLVIRADVPQPAAPAQQPRATVNRVVRAAVRLYSASAAPLLTRAPSRGRRWVPSACPTCHWMRR